MIANKLVGCFFLVLLSNCQPQNKVQADCKNPSIREHRFLTTMYGDDFYPKTAVDECHKVLIDLCISIEAKPPESLEALYVLTHRSTRKLNDLQSMFDQQGSEIETVARECLGQEILFIAEAYGFNADMEELIAPREW